MCLNKSPGINVFNFLFNVHWFFLTLEICRNAIVVKAVKGPLVIKSLPLITFEPFVLGGVNIWIYMSGEMLSP